jgi:hypothetical protein
MISNTGFYKYALYASILLIWKAHISLLLSLNHTYMLYLHNLVVSD